VYELGIILVMIDCRGVVEGGEEREGERGADGGTGGLE